MQPLPGLLTRPTTSGQSERNSRTAATTPEAIAATIAAGK